MKMGDTMLNLYVLDAVSSEKVPAEIEPASKEDLAATHDWQTNWESTYEDSCLIKSHFTEKTIMNCLA